MMIHTSEEYSIEHVNLPLSLILSHSPVMNKIPKCMYVCVCYTCNSCVFHIAVSTYQTLDGYKTDYVLNVVKHKIYL